MSETNSTVASRAVALEMFKGSVPCIFALQEPSCTATATCLAVPTHVGTYPEGCAAEPAPVCDTHRRQLLQSLNPFWRVWTNAPTPACEDCGVEIRITIAPL